MIVTAVDYHTAGEPFRIVTGGVRPIRGSTMLEKRRFAREHLDSVRELLVYEPRGHADMYGCFLTDPVDDGADLGVVFFHNAGYSTACGHGTIALATAALETGMLPASEPETTLVLDVPSGRLPVVASVAAARVEHVRFRNVPSFVFAEGLSVETSRGEVETDIAYGGAFYAFVQAGGVGLSVEPENVGVFIALGREIKRELERAHEIAHPLEPELRDVYGVVFVQEEAREPLLRERNVAIFADGEVDRSPCGSGTSARLALLDRRRTLPRGRTLVSVSVIGSEFEARVVAEARVDAFDAVVPEVGGSAHLTGFHQFVLQAADPLGTGFLLR
ncbi:MAG: proline racemase family protein [Actinomycetota bacterium]|nr:proline racemase family protein [Actinomycetota bacterium]